MYLAELRGKLSSKLERSEDILTSNVFSFFKYSNRRIFLRPFLKNLGFTVSIEDVEKADFQFWPRYPDNTEPDLVLVVGNYYILIEAKYFSSFEWLENRGMSQLIREIKGGSYEANNLNKEFYLLAVTADYLYRSENFFRIGEEINPDRIKWINWQLINGMISNILDNEKLPLEIRLFGEDLCQLLDQKNLRSYRDIKVALDYSTDIESFDKVFLAAETADLRGDFIGFQSTLSHLPSFDLVPKVIFLRKKPFFSKQLSFKQEILPIDTFIFYSGGTNGKRKDSKSN